MNSIGIRRTFGDKAKCSAFGGVKCGLDQEDLRGFADDVLKRLAGGASEAKAKEWVDAAIA